MVARAVALVLVLAAALVEATPAHSEMREKIRFGPQQTALQRCDTSASTLGLPLSSATCYEPSVAVDRRNRIFVTDAFGDAIAVSSDGGGSYEVRAAPPAPIGDAVLLGDAIVQIDPRGRLVFSNIYASGVQVAISSTGGRTWDSNVLVGVGPVSLAPMPDRQWVAFGPHGAVYVFWNSGAGVSSAASSDGGRSFSAPAPFVPTTKTFDMGQPVVDAAGRVFVPLILDAGYGQPYAAAVAVSSSGVAPGSFAVRVVATETSDFFPMLAVSRGGRVAFAWRGTVGSAHVLHVSSSSDHARSWTVPATWSRGYDVTSSPWLSFRDERSVDVAWFGVIYPHAGARLFVSRGPAGGGPRLRAAVTDVGANSPTGRSEANTDYAHYARLRDGRIVIAWCDTSVYAAAETKGR